MQLQARRKLKATEVLTTNWNRTKLHNFGLDKCKNMLSSRLRFLDLDYRELERRSGIREFKFVVLVTFLGENSSEEWFESLK